MIRPYSIDDPPATPHGANDEFAPCLSGNWTVLAGTRGRVDPQGTTGGIYDLDTVPGSLLLQPSNGNPIKLVAPLTLADGESVVLCQRVGLKIPGTENSIDLGLTLTASSTDYAGASDFVTCHFDSEPGGGRIYMGDGTREGGFAANSPFGQLLGRKILLRMQRQGSNYLPMYSSHPRRRGDYWTQGPTLTPASGGLLYLHLYAVVTEAISGPLPIHWFDWVRVGGAAPDPW